LHFDVYKIEARCRSTASNCILLHAFYSRTDCGSQLREHKQKLLIPAAYLTNRYTVIVFLI